MTNILSHVDTISQESMKIRSSLLIWLQPAAVTTVDALRPRHGPTPR
jgi:hypothetical protein